MIGLNVSDEDSEMMEMLSARRLWHKHAVRLQALLRRADGKRPGEIAEFLGLRHLNTVRACVRRYNAGGVTSLLRDKTRKPGKKPVSQAAKNRLCKLVCAEKPRGERLVIGGVDIDYSTLLTLGRPHLDPCQHRYLNRKSI